MKTKRLVIATPLYPPESGGPATYAATIERLLPARGCDVTVVKFGEVRHAPKIARHLLYAYRVWRALRRADAVLALDPVSVGLPACIAARLLRKPLVVKVVGDYAWEQGTQRFGITESLDIFTESKKHYPFPVRLLRAIQRYVVCRAQSVVVPSVYWKTLLTHWGVAQERVHVVYNAVSRISDTIQCPAGAPAGRFIVSASRLVPWKGMDGVLRAMRTLIEMGMPLPLIIVGDGPERTRLEMLTKTLKIEASVTFMGALPREDALAYIAHAEVFVLNTSYEGFSHLILEAFAVGTPVITTPVGGNAEVIEDGVTGLLVPYQDTEALASQIRSLAMNPALRGRLVDGARQKLASFTEDAMITGLLAALP